MDRDFLLAQRSKPLVLLLGSNVGDRHDYMHKAMESLIEAFGPPHLVSELFETEPWGYTEQNSFLNQAVVFETNQKPHIALDTVLTIEQELGRKREVKWGPRVIDIDIIFYGNLVYQSDVLEIPHPYVQDRMFVLDPLCDIIPEFEHPLLEKSVHEMREALKLKEANE
jgi:2-amino-4-hydroxy-6-hydroxymethyldihydropteridine diphosphokinase